MKLLLDENLSRRLVPFLQNNYPGSTQVAMVGLERADDRTIWHYARENEFIIVTRDADFEELASIYGSPPQVVWIRMPNQAKSAVLNMLIKHEALLRASLQEMGITCVELGPQGITSPAVPPAPTFSRGFTLTEMAVVLVIVALLIGGMIMPMSAQQEARLSAETQTTLRSVQESLQGFVVVNGRLPCPANPALATGVEDCTRQWGALPWTLMGVTPTDAWGRLFTYRVTDSFKDALPGGSATLTPPATCTTIPSQSSFALCSEGDITITDGAATPNTIADKVPVIVVSHGANGRGAYLPGGTTIPAGTGNELENSNGNATFVSKTPDPNFDDIVIWLPTSILTHRMIAAGRLP